MTRALISILIATVSFIYAQEPVIHDSLQNVNTNFHFQLTSVSQHKFKMTAPYTGTNSLIKRGENANTLTATIFWGVKLWKNAALYINEEVAGGSGVSGAHGVAGFTNGEAFRVGNPSPTIYLARGFIKQTFNFGDEKEYVGDEANSVYKYESKKYLDIVVGKFGVIDYFDENKYSHDPRSQFLNWSLMSNGAWDYPANVRGLYVGAVVEYGSPSFSIRAGAVMVPTQANGNVMDKKINKANSSMLEIEKPFSISSNPGSIKLLGFYTQTHMGNYVQAVQNNPISPDITATRKCGRTKYGVGLNAEQQLARGIGAFARASWNDGKNETWAFTEIDRSVSAGLVIDGSRWKRKELVFGLATAFNGLSKYHRDYLAAGGYGFIIGDGALNYGTEWISEVYLRACVFFRNFFVTPNFQYVVNPAYNKDRGPAYIMGLRVHVEF